MSVGTLRARLGAAAASALVAGTVLATSPATAAATTARAGGPATAAQPASASTSRHAAAQRHHERLVHRVLHVASKQKGKPYRYGGDGPGSFDCSGLVRYVFLQAVHRSLPHNAAQQYHSIAHLKRHSLQPGDLVFVDSGGYISHVGIFAGHHRWWVAPHTGTHVQLQRIYHAHLLYGRVLRYPH